MSGPDMMLVGPRQYAMIVAEIAAVEAAAEPGFSALDWRKQKRLQRRARERAIAELPAAS